MAHAPKLGSGKRFKALANKFAHKDINNPGALAAKIGREKYGKKKFQKLASAGKKRHEKMREEHQED
jgi:hypothetical protein